MSAFIGMLAQATPPAEPGGVSDKAHLFLAAVVLAALVFTVAGVRRHRLRSRYSLLWLVIVAAMVPLAAFPDLLDELSVRLGVSYPPATLLALSVAFLFLVIVHLSWEVSRADDRSRVLAEEIALLRAELDRRLPEPAGGDADERSADRNLTGPGRDDPREGSDGGRP